MWVMVFFDLPVLTPEERKEATKFRKDLMTEGFTMFQFSIYMRHCASKEKAEVHMRRVRNFLPKKGKVGLMMITDKQLGMMEIWMGTQFGGNVGEVQQLTMF